MKKILFILMMLLGCSFTNVSAQTYQRKGNTFRSVSTSRTKADTLLTSFLYEDNKGLSYPIIINKQNGRCWVWRKSSKTGKMYKSYMKKDLCMAVSEELGITYKEK